MTDVEDGHSSYLKAFELTGIEGECLGLSFSNDGNSIVICGNDKQLLFFDNYRRNKKAISIQGHKKAVLEVCWNKKHEFQFSSCSADKTACLWDVEKFECISKLKGHTKIINSCKCDKSLIATGSDDGLVCIWDTRIQSARSCIYKHESKYPITTISPNEEWNQIFAGGIDNNIYWIDIRASQSKILATLSDTITSLDICPYNSSLVSNCMNNQIIVWDIRPHSEINDRKVNTLIGAKHGFEQILHRVRWNHDGDLIAAASSDSIVYIWSVRHKKLINKLTGHQGATTDICFHPNLPIVASAGVDKRVLIGEFV